MLGFVLSNEQDRTVQYDQKLAPPLDFVCKVLNVKKTDFVSLALVNLLEEELDWIKYDAEIQVDTEDVETQQKLLTEVKMGINARVLKQT